MTVAAATTDGAPLRGGRRTRGRLAELVPGVLVAVVALVLAFDDGGFAATTWYTAGLFLVALLAVFVLFAPGALRDRPGMVGIAIGAFGAFAVVTIASVLWARDQGAAWEGGNRALVYAVAFAIVALRPWRRVEAEGLLIAITAALGIGAIVVLAITALRSDPAAMFLEGRLASPIEYANATANLWLIGLYPALWLGTASQRGWLVRAAGLGLANLLLQVAVLSQSRGAAIAFVVASVAYLVLTPRRFPALLGFALLAALLAVSFDRLTDVRTAATTAALEDAFGSALGAIITTSIVAVALGGAAALLARRLPDRARGPRARTLGNRLIAGLAVLAVLAGLVAIGSPSAWLQDRWTDFKTSGYTQVDTGSNRFGGSLGSNRYDFWRVSLDDFRDKPVLGIGADGFQVSYLQRRRSAESPRYPHSLPMQLLEQTGIVGFALFALFVLAALAAALQARRRAGLTGGGMSAAALAGFIVWLVHGSADWLWHFPGLSLLALVLLALAARLRDDQPPPDAPSGEPVQEPAGSGRPVGVGVFVAALVLVAISLIGPGLSARFVQTAYGQYARDPSGTFSDLDRAAQLDPLSAEPLVALGILARRSGRDDVALRALRRAVGRQPTSWFAQAELAMQESTSGSKAAAVEHVARARRLNPRQATLAELQRTLQQGRAVDPSKFEAILTQQGQQRLVPVGGG